MTEPIDPKPEQGDATEPSASNQATPIRRNPRRTKALIAVVVGAIIVGLLQWAAPNFDHQYANMISIAVGLLVTLYLLFQAHQAVQATGRRWLVPACTLGFVIGFNVLFEYDGVSGELIPQFRYRFRAARDLPTVAKSNDTNAATETSFYRPEAKAAADSPQFLGPNRTGVIAKRAFSIPTKASDLKVLWDQSIGEGWGSFAVAGDRAVTLEQRDDQECVTCYRLADGELLWMQSYEANHYHALGGAGPRTTPTIVDSLVYAQGSSGRIWCLDLQSGEPKWKADLLALAGWEQTESESAILWGRAGSPLIVDGLCVVPFATPVDSNNPQKGERSLIAFDASSGEVRWKAGSDQISYASPVVLNLLDKKQIVSVNEKTITGHEIEDGTVLWTCEWLGRSDGDANCSSAVPLAADRFLIGKGYNHGSAVVQITQSKSGYEAERIWESTRLLETKFTHACVMGDIAYALSDGTLQAVDLADDGKKLWSQSRRSRFHQGQILLVEDVIVGQTEAGEVVFVDADPGEYRERLRVSALSSKTWNIPTVAGRHLLVRNDRQAICYLLPDRD